ncbi:50S ribosomal protein L11 methyltransferase [Sorangium cellulosum]|uniref:50S ribosomal protein L11 methyltransferase n=1 Tax=Sorangium cellulosum TaxID=56 RepID=A0A2L0EUQ5_SORCE|nr:50S ribosomal protein L11 methyltransferase [Sorangium cellulosum]AUX43038.1 50S ribosomal protein L11 methyltransferase [Sorangium cellulosum]
MPTSGAEGAAGGASPVESAAAFVARETAVACSPLVPEVKLHLATEVTPLWHATEAALARAGVPPPYWAFAWAGGQALARYLLDHPAAVSGKRVLDLAAGGGVVSIAAARAGAAHVSAADIDPFAAAALSLNAALNGVSLAVLTEDLTARDADVGAWDVIVAGDVCYERAMVDKVLPWLRRQAGRVGAVLVGDPGRTYCPSEGIEELARYLVPTSLDLEGRAQRETRVLRLLAGG